MAYRVVGRVKDAHGLKGEIWVVLFAGQADWFDSLVKESKFRLSKSESGDNPDKFIELPLKSARPHKNGLILQSSNVADRTAAEALKGTFLAIPENYLVSEEGDSYFLSEIEGFRVKEGERDIGVISGFSHNGAQDLLIVTLAKGVRDGVKEKDIVEIPFVEELVTDVDDEAKSIQVSLPDGLIEVQLGLDKNDDSIDESAGDSGTDDLFDDSDE